MKSGKIVVVEEEFEDSKILNNTLNIMLDKSYDVSLEALKVYSIDFEKSNPKKYQKKLPCFAQCVGKTENSYKDSSYDNIYISQFFADTYNLQDQEIVNFQFVKKLVPLKSVLLIPKDSNSIKLTSEKNFRERLMFHYSCLNNETKILINECEYYIVDTNPTMRGIITEETSVLVLNDVSLFPTKTDKKDESYKPQFLCNSLFVSKKKLFFEEDKKMSLKLSVMNDSKFFNFLTNFKVDPLSMGIVSMNTLKILNCFNGSWVNFSLPNKNGKCLFIVALSTNFNDDNEFFEIEDNQVYVSPFFSFNLDGYEAQPQFIEKEFFGEVTVSQQKIPTHGDRIQLEIIKSPNLFNNEDEQRNKDLSDFDYYFNQPRVLSEGDIFGIYDVKSDKSKTYFDPSHKCHYFKVITIEGSKNELDGYIIDKDTELAINNETTSSIPPNYENFYKSPNAIIQTDFDSIFKTSSYQKVKDYIISILSFQHKMLNPLFSLLLYGDDYSIPLCVRSMAQRFGIHLIEFNAYELLSEDDIKTDDNIKQIVGMANECTPCIVHFKNFEAIAINDASIPSSIKGSKVRHITTLTDLFTKNKIGKSMIFIASTEKLDNISIPFRSMFSEKIQFSTFSEEERENILKDLFHEIPVSKQVSMKYISKQIAGASLKDLFSLISSMEQFASLRLQENYGKFLDQIQISGPMILLEDFERSLVKFKKSTAGKIGTPQIPNVTWKDIGGLEDAKSELLECIQIPLQQPHLFNSSLKQRSGVLLYGPPGTGKTLLAKAVATECSLNFLSVKGPELINSYVGESEKNIRDVFRKAREARPCVIFFDELDSLAPNRGVSGDSGGVMDRVVAQLLAELDGVQENQQKQQQVFIIAATNRPDLLDPALLRPGRFDRLVYLSISSTKEQQIKIMKALTRKFNLGNTVNFEELSKGFQNTFTGADFYALCSDALMKSIMRIAQQFEIELSLKNEKLEKKMEMNTYLNDKEDVKIIVEQDDFKLALMNLTPSVSQKDLQHYESVQQKYQKK
eukprot:gene11432-4599_t